MCHCYIRRIVARKISFKQDGPGCMRVGSDRCSLLVLVDFVHAISHSRRSYSQDEKMGHCAGLELSTQCGLVEKAIGLVMTIEKIYVNQMFEDRWRRRHGKTEGVSIRRVIRSSRLSISSPYQESSLPALSLPPATDIEGRCIVACGLLESLRFTGGGIDSWSWESSTIAIDPLRAVPLSDCALN